MPKPATNFNPKHTKDRVRRVWSNDKDSFVVVDATGQFLGQTGVFGDAGDARLMTSGAAVTEARKSGGDILNIANHPQLAVLFYTNR